MFGIKYFFARIFKPYETGKSDALLQLSVAIIHMNYNQKDFKLMNTLANRVERKLFPNQ